MTPPDVPRFPKLDPASAAFWDARFEAGFTPWDHDGVPADLLRFAETQPRPLRVLIPGCGHAPEIQALSELGWDVTAIDFSNEAVTRARQRFSEFAAQIQFADFFSYEPAGTLDLVYERAFLCALPRTHWPAWVERVSYVLPAGGRLAGFFFMDGNPKGPPFGLAEGEINTMLAPNFELIETLIPTDSNTVFSGKERWMVWQRR